MTEFKFYNLARSMNKSQKASELWIKKDGFKLSSILDWKVLEAF